MRRIKVYPDESIELLGKQIDDDIEKIISSIDEEVKTTQKDSGISSVSRYSKGQPQKKEVFLKPSPLTSDIPKAFQSNVQANGIQLQDILDEHDQEEMTEQDDDGDEEEVFLTHQTEHGVNQLIQDFKVKLVELEEQIKEFQTRTSKLSNKFKESEEYKYDAEEKIQTLEEENQSLLDHISQTGQRDPRTDANGPTNRVLGLNRVRLNLNDSRDISRGEAIRKALLAFDDDDAIANFDDLSAGNKAYYKFRNWLKQFAPFEYEIKYMQTRFGASCAAFFAFYRYLYFQYIFIGMFTLAFAIYHGFVMTYNGQYNNMFGISLGLTPGIMLFSSYTKSESVYYSTAITFSLVAFTFSAAGKFLKDDHLNKELNSIESQNESPFGNDVLCAWDFSLSSKEAVQDYAQSLRDTYTGLIATTRREGKLKQRSLLDNIILVLRRVTGFILYVGVQSVSFALIIYWTINASEVTDPLSGIPILGSLSSIILGLLLNVINAFTPTAIKIIDAFECWDSFEISTYYLSFRIFLSNFLNTALLGASFLFLADPFLAANYPAIRKPIQVPHKDGTCRIDEVGDGLLTILLTSLPSDMILIYLVALKDQLIAYILQHPYVKKEFELSESILRVLNFVSLSFMCLPFNPLVVLLMPTYVYLNVKIEKALLLQLYSKPKHPWKAQRASSFFTVVYIASMVSISIPWTLYFLSTRTFAKNCDIQDHYVDLCLYHSADPSLCVLNTNSEFYSNFKEYSENYPAVICKEACGPFVNHVTAFEPLNEYITTTIVLRYLWWYLVELPYFPWLASLILFILCGRYINSIAVTEESKVSTESVYKAKVATLQAENSKLSKKIEKLKTIQSDNLINE